MEMNDEFVCLFEVKVWYLLETVDGSNPAPVDR